MDEELIKNFVAVGVRVLELKGGRTSFDMNNLRNAIREQVGDGVEIPENRRLGQVVDLMWRAGLLKVQPAALGGERWALGYKPPPKSRKI